LHFYFRGLKIILAPGASDNLNPPLRTWTHILKYSSNMISYWLVGLR
jgi:hypothetical protein